MKYKYKDKLKPKTVFAKKLLKFRKRAISKGMRLLSVDEILAEKHKNRE